MIPRSTQKLVLIAFTICMFLTITTINAETSPIYFRGDVITIQTGVLNPGEVDIVHSHIIVHLISENGTRIKTGEYVSDAHVAPGEGLYVEIIWNSTGAELGFYDIELTGEAIFASEKTLEINSLIEDEFRLESPLCFKITNLYPEAMSYVEPLSVNLFVDLENNGLETIDRIELTWMVYKDGVLVVSETNEPANAYNEFSLAYPLAIPFASGEEKTFRQYVDTRDWATENYTIALKARCWSGEDTRTEMYLSESGFEIRKSVIDFSINSVASDQTQYIVGNVSAWITTTLQNTGDKEIDGITLHWFITGPGYMLDYRETPNFDLTYAMSTPWSPAENRYYGYAPDLNEAPTGKYTISLYVTGTCGEESLRREYYVEEAFEILPLYIDFELTNLGFFNPVIGVGGDPLEPYVLLQNTGTLTIEQVSLRWELYRDGALVGSHDIENALEQYGTGVVLEMGELLEFYGSFNDTDFSLGTYTLRLLATCSGSGGEPVSKEITLEDALTVEASKLDFEIEDVYVPGTPFHMDNEEAHPRCRLTNTGNMPIDGVRIDYLFYLDGELWGFDTGNKERVGALFYPGTDYVNASVLNFLTLDPGVYDCTLVVTVTDTRGETLEKSKTFTEVLEIKLKTVDFTLSISPSMVNNQPMVSATVSNTGEDEVASLNYKLEAVKDGKTEYSVESEVGLAAPLAVGGSTTFDVDFTGVSITDGVYTLRLTVDAFGVDGGSKSVVLSEEEVTVGSNSGGSRGIPGFPLLAVALGLVLVLFCRNMGCGAVSSLRMKP